MSFLCTEIDRAFKQFVFEAMDLKVTDPNGFIMTLEGEGLLHSAIPWDDPYPFFKGMIPKHEKSLSPNIPIQPSPSDDPTSGHCLFILFLLLYCQDNKNLFTLLKIIISTNVFNVCPS